MSNYYYNLRKKTEKKIYNINRRGYYSPAINKLINSGFNTSYIPKGELRDAQITFLEYINKLKTFSVYGAKRYVEKYQEIFDTIEESEYKDELYKLYNDLVHENLLYEKFKYEIFTDLINLFDEGLSNKDIIDNIRDKYRNDINFYERQFSPQITF